MKNGWLGGCVAEAALDPSRCSGPSKALFIHAGRNVTMFRSNAAVPGKRPVFRIDDDGAARETSDRQDALLWGRTPARVRTCGSNFVVDPASDHSGFRLVMARVSISRGLSRA